MKALQRALPDRLSCLVKGVKKAVASCADPVRRNFYSAQPAGEQRGRVLIAHLVEGVLLGPDDPLIQTHNHFVEARLMTEVFLELGYAVDFIDYRNSDFVPRRKYDVFVCPRINFERLESRLPPECIKIVHLDTAHWLYSNAAALRRLQELQARRGVALTSFTEIKPNYAIEVADYATMLGNDYTYEGYAFARKPVFQIPNPGSSIYPWHEDKDFGACKTRFLWLGSRGLVHKGLDLALEAFAKMPDLHLTVCGPIEQDAGFVRAFHTELYETPNIHTHGWIDTASDQFAALVKRTVAHIYPTCAEGSCGAVINCMHAGLIPVTTRQAGVDIDPSFGVLLAEPGVEAVMEGAQHIAALPANRLADMARRSQQEAQHVYSAELYKKAFAGAIGRIVRGHPGAALPGFVTFDALVS